MVSTSAPLLPSMQDWRLGAMMSISQPCARGCAGRVAVLQEPACLLPR